MVSLVEMNNRRNATFAIDSTADIVKLPTTKKYGTDEVSTVQPIVSGSAAYLTNGTLDIYILNGETDTWIKS